MTRRLTVLVEKLREALAPEIKGYKSSPGPKGQTCESCEYGECFDDDKAPQGWCRRWDRDVTRSAWCEGWTRSTRLDTPEIPVNDSPERVKEKPKGNTAAKPAAKKKAKLGGFGGGGPKKKPGSKITPKPPFKPRTPAGGGAEPEPEPAPEPEA
jgi:hypothetical protein